MPRSTETARRARWAAARLRKWKRASPWAAELSMAAQWFDNLAAIERRRARKGK